MHAKQQENVSEDEQKLKASAARSHEQSMAAEQLTIAKAFDSKRSWAFDDERSRHVHCGDDSHRYSTI
jgi:hypothetical protein